MTPIIFFFNDTATTEIYTLSLHDALPISGGKGGKGGAGATDASNRRCPDAVDGAPGQAGSAGPTGSQGASGPRSVVVTAPTREIFGVQVPPELGSLLERLQRRP